MTETMKSVRVLVLIVLSVWIGLIVVALHGRFFVSGVFVIYWIWRLTRPSPDEPANVSAEVEGDGPASGAEAISEQPFPGWRLVTKRFLGPVVVLAALAGVLALTAYLVFR